MTLPPLRRLPPLAVLLVTALAVPAGCLSNQYRISGAELRRLADLPPAARGQRVRVVQETGEDREPVQPAPPAPYPGQYAGQPPNGGAGYGDPYGYGAPYGAPPPTGDGGGVGVAIGFEMDLSGRAYAPSGGPAPRATQVAPPVGATRAPARAVSPGVLPGGTAGGAAASAPMTRAPAGPTQVRSPASSGSGAGIDGLGKSVSGSSSSGMGEELVFVAILLTVVAAMAAVGLVGTEGIRYDGDVALHPGQPLHLRHAGGGEWLVALGDLAPAHLAGVKEGAVVEGEGWAILRLARAPLDRRGFAFRVEAGTSATHVDDYTLWGLASNIQIGYFPHQRVGLLGTLSLSGTSDRIGRTVARHAAGGELQLYPLRLGRLHLGAYGNAARVLAATQDQVQGALALGAGGLLEIDVTTRLALGLRGGLSFTHLPDRAWDRSATITAGVAVY